jgi:hypothetical protein
LSLGDIELHTINLPPINLPPVEITLPQLPSLINGNGVEITFLEGINGAINTITDTPQTAELILEQSIDGLEYLFIPSDGFLTSEINELKGTINEKFGIIETIQNFFETSFADSFNDNTAPVFDFDVVIQGTPRQITINWSFLNPHISYVKGFLLVISWVFGLRVIWKKLSYLLKGVP